MVKSQRAPDLDRYLILKGRRYHYKRRVPVTLAHLDDRAPHVRQSLNTTDLILARRKRDILEGADDALWQAMLEGVEPAITMSAYDATVARAKALRFVYREASSVAEVPLPELVQRVSTMAKAGGSKAVDRAVLGFHVRPRIKISEAFDVYVDQIAGDDLRGKSEQQRKDWLKVKKRALTNFIEIVGDLPISTITRDDALKVFEFWRARISPTDAELDAGKLITHSPSSGNRDLGNLRILFGDYHRHIGEMDRFNPFVGLSFADDEEKTRPPFTVEWIRDTIMAPGVLAGLNDEARAIPLLMIETGARPSELSNLMPGDIILDHDVPHLSIRPRRERHNPREIKTTVSIRQIPLVGVSLAAAKAHPHGFPRYREKSNGLSGTLMKYFRENGLFPTQEHAIYSFRHSFEDRMKEAHIDEELRRILMGHALDRPRYGAGGSLAWRRDNLLKFALPFDEAIV